MGRYLFVNNGPKRFPFVNGKLFINGKPTIVEDILTINACKALGWPWEMAGVGPIYSPPSPPTPSAPEWVKLLKAPSGALPWLASDFANGQYWESTLGTCTIDQLWVEDLNWSHFNEDLIIPGSGLPANLNNSSGAIMQSAIKERYLDGYTTLAVWNYTAGTKAALQPPLLVELPDIKFELLLSLGSEDWASNSFMSGSATSTSGFLVHPLSPTFSTNTGVFSIHPDYSSAACMDGNPVNGNVGASMAAAADVAPPTDVAFLIQPDGSVPVGDACIALIAIYPVQPDADLPTISGL